MSKDIILITGASSNIGQHVVERLLSNKNILLAIYYKNQFKLKKNSKGKIIQFKCDLSNELKVVDLIKKISNKKLIPNKVTHIASNPL